MAESQLVGTVGKLLSSPLFLLGSLVVWGSTAVIVIDGGRLLQILPWSVMIQTLLSAVVWQYLVLSLRLDDLMSRTSESVGTVDTIRAQTGRGLDGLDKRLKAHARETADAHELQLKMLDGLQQNLVQTEKSLVEAGAQEGDRVTKLLARCEAILAGLERGADLFVDSLDESFDQMTSELVRLNTQQSVQTTAVQGKLIEDALGKLDVLEQALEKLHVLERGLEKLDRTTARVNERWLSSYTELRGGLQSLESDVKRLHADESQAVLGAVEALQEEMGSIVEASIGERARETEELARSLDRLNIEVRRQLAALRASLGSSSAQ